jgi:hypothetical protein
MLKGLGCFKFSTNGFSIVTLCHGKDNGKDFYAFVAIEPQNFRTFKKRYVPGEASNFAAYGFELLRGWGSEPSEAMMDYLLAKHGIEFGISENFINRVIANIDPVPTPLGREYFVNTLSSAAV